MKRILLLPLLCLLSTSVFAQNIRIVKGNIDFLKDVEEIGAVFTYDNMNVGKMTEANYRAKKIADYNQKEPGRGDRWGTQWVEDRQNRFEPKFIELFNKYISEKSDMSMVAGGDARYVFHINTDFTEPGFNVGVSRRNASVDLSILVMDGETGEQLARIAITGASANSFTGADFDAEFRIQECYAKAGRELAKFIIKTLKLK